MGPRSQIRGVWFLPQQDLSMSTIDGRARIWDVDLYSYRAEETVGSIEP